jgi:dinuclear metal center YbgI/SA1388 family protein
MIRSELENFLNSTLKPEIFDDYCPNGLQIEGKTEIRKILFSLSATKESALHAVKIKADAMIVHHGLFWKFHGVRTITGTFYNRISPLIKNDINLLGYHLPLDGHIEFGNAASLAKEIGLKEITPFGEYKKAFTGVKGKLDKPMSGNELKNILEKILNHHVLYSNPIESTSPIQTIGIITGGANSQWIEAYKLGLDAYITGEMSEHDWHESREAGVHMFAGGHHSTERLGIMALMNKIKNQFPNLEVSYFESENPA